MQDLSAPLASAARAVAERLSRTGTRAWIVGGGVRDLALGREVEDVDMASAATPELVEATFERTIPLGRSFGTLVIHLDGHDVEHTTFRSEEGHSDARRPDAVTFGASPEEDARRRDFTCNALYLDPLRDELLDPTGGLSDLEAGRLACVGDPRRRFAEDGLRIVRMARFAGQLGLEPTATTRAAAIDGLASLRGVSRERIHLELESLMRRGGAARALAVLFETGVLEVILPLAARGVGERTSILTRLPPRPGAALGFAVLLMPGPASWVESVAALESLKPSTELRERVVDTWRLLDEFATQSGAGRATRIRWMRRRGFDEAVALGRARALARGQSDAWFEELRLEAARLAPSGIAPSPFVTSEDLRRHGLVPGPRFGEILREAEALQLEGLHEDRAAALRWLDARLQDGGNTRRNA